MGMQILDGKKLSKEILENVSEEVQELKINGNPVPRLDVVVVGDDFGSMKYVQMKEKTAKEVGLEVNVHYLSEDTRSDEIVYLIDCLNRDTKVTGIMVQLPLPSGIDTNVVLESISPQKDVDGLTAVNLGRLFQGNSLGIAPATPVGIMKLLEKYGIDVCGKRVVILGTSNIVGIPLLAMLVVKDATVTLCNSKTKDLKSVCKDADILVSATGIPFLIKGEYLKKGCVVIDVGSNKHPETGKVVGDVDWESVDGIPSFVTPVPGGVGPMTIACLMLNLMTCWRNAKR